MKIGTLNIPNIHHTAAKGRRGATRAPLPATAGQHHSFRKCSLQTSPQAGTSPRISRQPVTDSGKGDTLLFHTALGPAKADGTAP